MQDLIPKKADNHLDPVSKIRNIDHTVGRAVFFEAQQAVIASRRHGL